MTPEQSGLVAKAAESVIAAKLLFENALYDFSASRAYYAMFYIAQAMLIGEGLEFSKHAGVIASFGREFAKSRRVEPHFHQYLIEGQTIRSVGDYSTDIKVTRVQAETQIQHADAFIVLGKTFLGDKE